MYFSSHLVHLLCELCELHCAMWVKYKCNLILQIDLLEHSGQIYCLHCDIQITAEIVISANTLMFYGCRNGRMKVVFHYCMVRNIKEKQKYITWWPVLNLMRLSHYDVQIHFISYIGRSSALLLQEEWCAGDSKFSTYFLYIHILCSIKLVFGG